MASQKKNNKDNLLLVNWEVAETALFQKQYIILTGLMLLILLVYTVRLWQLQIIDGAKYRYQSENNRIRLEEIHAPRGIIFDRNGTPLVENRPAYHLLLIREDVQDMKKTIEEISALTGHSVEELNSVVEANKNTPKFLPIRLLSDLDRDCLARIEAQRVRLPGVFIQLEPKREYRWNGTAAHLIGYLSEITENELRSKSYQGYFMGEDIGKYGIEGSYEKYLHGTRGGRQVEVDAIGRRMRLLDEVLPIPGRNLWLTIDIELQKVAESCLDGRVGSIVALDPNTGAVLAMANNPTFDQEKFIRGLTKEEWLGLSKDPRHPLLNRAISATYPPGSTYKPFVAIAALSEGVVTPDTNFHCPGFLAFAGRDYHCWRHGGHGSVNLLSALTQSCDVYFYQCGLRLGVDRLAHYSNLFGLGERTGINLSGELAGLIPTSAWKKQVYHVPWQKGENLSIAIGQGFDLVTPLQLALGYGAIANGGKLWQPYVVRRIEGNSAAETDEEEGKLIRKIPVDPRYIDIVKKGLLNVVEDPRGTGHAIREKSLLIAGKTGTAQVIPLLEGPNRKGAAISKDQFKDHAWFAGYAPADNPQIVVAAIIEHGGHGASVAAPLVKKVIDAYMSLQAGTPAPADSNQ
jgi:penicillin-binding protein 2